MSRLIHPAVLSDLSHVGDRGLPLPLDSKFREELDLCRRWGFKIDSAGDRVHLIFDYEQLVPQWLQEETPAIAWDRLRASGYLRLVSTNTEARDLAEKGAPSGTLVFSEEQTGGRGRHNRSWHSPAGAGLYCTLIVRPKLSPAHWPMLTHVASVALVETIGDLAGLGIIPAPLDIDLKWPNDVLLSGRKCAGILLEALCNDAESAAALVGFGINVHKESVPAELADEAACLDDVAHAYVPRRLLLGLYLKHFQICYLMLEQGKGGEVLERWKSSSSMHSGTTIYVGKGEARREAVTCGLNDMGALRIRDSSGKMETLFAEDVSVSRKRS